MCPADNFETEQAVRLASRMDTPVYLRFGKKPMPLLPEANTPFASGKGRMIKEGDDIVLIGTGETVYPALLAAQQLEATHGICATVISMPTIKPLDDALIARVPRTRPEPASGIWNPKPALSGPTTSTATPTM